MRKCCFALAERSRSLFMNVQNTVAERSRSGRKKTNLKILRDLKMEAYDCKPVERFKLDILQDYEF